MSLKPMPAQKKIKLCVVTPLHWSAQMAGAEYQIKRLIDKLLPTERFEIHYLARLYAADFRAEGYQISRIADPTGIRRYGYFFDTFRLLNLLRGIRPDVIYQRVGCAYTGIAAYYAGKTGCRMVWHIARDDDVLPVQSGTFLGKPHHYAEKKFLEYGIRSSRTIIAQTYQQAEYLKTYYGRVPTEVIRNFHPLPEEEIRKTDPVKIVWISALKPMKQPEYFIRLARDLDKLGERVECSMVGAPAHWSPDWQSSLEKSMKQVRCLTYLGERSMGEVNSLLARAHILVNTSLFEGLPNTFIQAWMRKVPVVSLNVDPDGLLHEHGMGFFAGTYEKLLEGVLQLAKSPELRRKMGERAQAHAFDNFSEKNIDSLLRVLLDHPL
jgi:glycosyltransferase involved in cell wall biosynthesis